MHLVPMMAKLLKMYANVLKDLHSSETYIFIKHSKNLGVKFRYIFEILALENV